MKKIVAYKKKRTKLAGQLAETEEMLQGSLIEKFIRCGKPGCRCQNDKGHGPHYYLSFREGKTTRLVYIPREEVPAVRGQIDQFKTYKATGSQICRLNLMILRETKKGRRNAGEKSV